MRWNPLKEFIDGQKIIARKAKFASKCNYGCEIKRGDVVVITILSLRKFNVNASGLLFRKEEPARFCPKHAIKFLCGIKKNIEKSLLKLENLGIDVLNIMNELKK